MKYEKADKYITCIVCPNGCEVEVKQNGDSISVSGNKCKRGEVYVVQELTDPRRTISTTALQCASDETDSEERNLPCHTGDPKDTSDCTGEDRSGCNRRCVRAWQ